MTNMKIETYTVIAPAHWASALVNGDYSGIECENECQRISDFEESLLPGSITGDVSEPCFIGSARWATDTPDELAGDYCEYTVIKAVEG